MSDASFVSSLGGESCAGPVAACDEGRAREMDAHLKLRRAFLPSQASLATYKLKEYDERLEPSSDDPDDDGGSVVALALTVATDAESVSVVKLDTGEVITETEALERVSRWRVIFLRREKRRLKREAGRTVKRVAKRKELKRLRLSIDREPETSVEERLEREREERERGERFDEILKERKEKADREWAERHARLVAKGKAAYAAIVAARAGGKAV